MNFKPDPGPVRKHYGIYPIYAFGHKLHVTSGTATVHVCTDS